MWRALSLGRPFGWQEGLERPESIVREVRVKEATSVSLDVCQDFARLF